MGRWLFSLALFGWLAFVAPAWAQANAFSDWAAVIVAGDWRAHDGSPSEVFDNARRDLSQSLVAAGFSPDHIRQFSVREAKATAPLKTDPDIIAGQLNALAQQTRGGCLVYFTSHGTPDGIVLGDNVWPPGVMARMVDDTCGKRPTVVVVSACFSGVFLPALAGPERMVLTAARPDRTSFGCGAEDRYTFFDACVLDELKQAHDFAALGVAVQGCVARREEQKQSISLPSEPQLDIGVALRPTLPLYAFNRPR